MRSAPASRSPRLASTRPGSCDQTPAGTPASGRRGRRKQLERGPRDGGCRPGSGSPPGVGQRRQVVVPNSARLTGETVAVQLHAGRRNRRQPDDNYGPCWTAWTIGAPSLDRRQEMGRLTGPCHIEAATNDVRDRPRRSAGTVPADVRPCHGYVGGSGLVAISPLGRRLLGSVWGNRLFVPWRATGEGPRPTSRGSTRWGRVGRPRSRSTLVPFSCRGSRATRCSSFPWATVSRCRLRRALASEMFVFLGFLAVGSDSTLAKGVLTWV